MQAVAAVHAGNVASDATTLPTAACTATRHLHFRADGVEIALST